jgi:hypothetical protein
MHTQFSLNTHAALYTRMKYETALPHEVIILVLMFFTCIILVFMFITMSLPQQVWLTNYAKLTRIEVLIMYWKSRKKFHAGLP